MIKKITVILGALGFLSAMTVSTLADGADSHSGGYLEVHGAAVGVELDANHKAASGTDTGSTTGTAGKFAIIGGLGAGYGIAQGDNLVWDIGVSIIPGKAKLSADSTNATDNDASLEISDLITLYVSPTYAVSDTAAIYFKAGYVEGTTKTTGDINKVPDLEGTTLAIGSRTNLANGLFIRTEAGYSKFDKVSTKGKSASCTAGTTNCILNTTTVSADPSMAYGQISIGVSF